MTSNPRYPPSAIKYLPVKELKAYLDKWNQPMPVPCGKVNLQAAVKSHSEALDAGGDNQDNQSNVPAPDQSGNAAQSGLGQHGGGSGQDNQDMQALRMQVQQLQAMQQAQQGQQGSTGGPSAFSFSQAFSNGPSASYQVE